MNRKRMTRVVSVLMLLALLIGVFPMTGVIGVVSAETGTGETDPEVTEATGTDALDVDETEIPEDSLEASPTDESETTESTADEDGISWLDADLLLLVNGQFIPYNPTTGEADIESSPNGTRAMPSGIYYSDVLGAHGSDLNGYNIKAGGIYDSWVYGTGAWYPYSTGVVATTGRRVITSKLYCNDGPSYYKTESGVLAIPIRPSQESGWSMDVNGYGDYTTRSTGVPTFKNESLYSKYVPTYSAATWTQINLIYGVAKGMGGMTSSGNANITAAASTLICNTVWGYIGLGSDKQFHGKPIMTSSSAVNQQMAEILVRCEVYSKEKNVTGTTTGDNTLNALRAKGFTPTDTTGWYVASGTAASTAMGYFQINRSQSNGNQVYIYATNEITFDNGKTISLKKTTQGSADVLACIQGNPLYTLQGAVYEIHQGSATGTVVETLTTNANGEATGTHKYTIGTKLYAVEKTAPSGYLLNATPVELTVSAGSNVFNVADTPTFDPAELVITKTGVDSERIQGAVFKAEFYASNWADSTKLLRTWYFSSDSNGFVYIRDDHLASGYSSSPLYKISGDVVFPLGCVVVTEVKTAEGYILPQGNDGKALIFVRQGGTKTAQSGKPAGAYWGDWSANPLNSANPLGIYKIENDADKSKLTAVNPEAYGAPFSLQKYGPSNIPLEGAVFRVDYYHSSWFDSTKLERTWYFKTNSNGYFTLASQYLASGYTSDALFPTGKIPLGIMKITEEKAPDGFKRVDLMGVWRMRQTESGSTNVESYWAAANGYTPTTSYGDVAYVLDSDPAKLYVLNEPDEAPVEIIKTSTDGAVSGISFKVEQYEPGVGWWTKGTYPTDASGKIELAPLTIGTRLRITEIVPENYVCTSTNPQTITVAASGNQVRFTNKPIATLEIVKTSTDGVVAGISFKVEKQTSGSWTTLGNYTTDQNGKISVPNLDVGMKLRITETVPANYVCTSTNPQTITLVKGTNRVSFANKPISSLEIVKTSTDGKVNGITFKVEKQASGRWTSIGSYVSDQNGRILIENLDAGLQIRVTEVVPENYVCISQNPQTLTLVKGTNSVSFENKPIAALEIVKTSTDGEVAGITFNVEKQASDSWTTLGSYVSDSEGRILIENLDVGLQLRITEVVPEGYECTSDNPKTVTLRQGSNRVTFTNTPIVPLEIIKTSEDGPVEGISFLVEQYEPTGGIGWWEMGMHYNPFHYIHSEKDILKLVTTLIVNTKGDGKTGDDFWVKAETLLYTALIGYIWYEALEAEQNMNTLIEMINAMEVREEDETYKNPVDLIFDELEEQNPQHFAVRQYKKYKLAAGKTAKSILISCGARLAPFDIAELREITSYDELELDTLGGRSLDDKQRTALFLIMSDTDTTFNFLISMIYSQLFNLLCEKADDEFGGRLPIHVRCLIDEAANIGQIPNLEKLVATIRSREISACLVWQAKSQIKSIYKDNADTIIGNMDSQLFLGGSEQTTLKDLSAMLGKETIDIANSGESRGRERSHSLNYQKLGKDLASMDELAVLDGGKCILQLRGVRPFLSDKYDITKHPNYQYLSDFDPRNKYDIAAHLNCQLQLKPGDTTEVFEIDESTPPSGISEKDG